jgi:hypothetical protein
MRINYLLFKLFGGCFFQIPSRKKKRETNDMLCDLLYKVFNFVSIKKVQKILKKLYIYIFVFWSFKMSVLTPFSPL